MPLCPNKASRLFLSDAFIHEGRRLMAKKPSISNAAAIKACDKITSLLDGASKAVLKLYSGTQPLNVDTPITSQVELAALTMSNPAFGAASDLAPGATAVANAIATAIASATALATWVRVFNSSGVAIIDGSAGTSDADAILDATSIQAGTIVQCVSFKYNVRET